MLIQCSMIMVGLIVLLPISQSQVQRKSGAQFDVMSKQSNPSSIIFLHFKISKTKNAEHIILVNQKIVRGKLKQEMYSSVEMLGEHAHAHDQQGLQVSILDNRKLQIFSTRLHHPLLAVYEYPQSKDSKSMARLTKDLTEQDFFIRIPYNKHASQISITNENDTSRGNQFVFELITE